MCWLSLFASTGTLICCALPSLLVALGMGTIMVGLVSTIPQIIWLSKYKVWVFFISGVLIFISGIIQHYVKSMPCPLDKDLASTCMTSRKWSGRILISSGLLWFVGTFFAFIAPKIFS